MILIHFYAEIIIATGTEVIAACMEGNISFITVTTLVITLFKTTPNTNVGWKQTEEVATTTEGLITEAITAVAMMEEDLITTEGATTTADLIAAEVTMAEVIADADKALFTSIIYNYGKQKERLRLSTASLLFMLLTPALFKTVLFVDRLLQV